MAIILRKLVDDTPELDDISNLESYLKISYLLSDSDRDKPIFTFAGRAFEIINKQDLSQRQKSTEIKTLVDYTKTI